MSTVTFDTLKLSRKLESAGFTHEQAVGAAEALADTLVDFVATKHDIELLRHDIEILKRDLTIRLGGMLVTGIVVVAALVKLL